MSTMTTTSPEKQQDDFTLSFLQWLNKNYRRTDNDEFVHHSQSLEPFRVVDFLTGAECLDIYRMQHIPPLPLMSSNLANQIMEVANENYRRNKALMTGYQRINAYLDNALVFSRQAIKDIIAETMEQIC